MQVLAFKDVKRTRRSARKSLVSQDTILVKSRQSDFYKSYICFFVYLLVQNEYIFFFLQL